MSVLPAEGQSLNHDANKAITKSLVDVLSKGSSDVRKRLIKDYDLRQLDVRLLTKHPHKFDLDLYPRFVSSYQRGSV